ncbi:MAG: hypothetical protein B7X34_09080 [Acidobacteriia bacterium 12-62-4]|nr:MAG: hypothetical protein B7X34_09080 [Acidobacteriia bacterium 12-62-4]
MLATGIGYGQQAIVNMPSADITPKGKHFLMHETQARAWGPGRSWSGTNFYAYGVGRSTELAVTSYNGGSPLARTFSTGVGFKSAPQFWRESRPELEAKLTVGQMMLFNHRGGGLGSFTYTHGSFRVLNGGFCWASGFRAGTSLAMRFRGCCFTPRRSR